MVGQDQNDDEYPGELEEAFAVLAETLAEEDVIGDDTAEEFDEYFSEGLRPEAPMNAINKLVDDIRSDED